MGGSSSGFGTGMAGGYPGPGWEQQYGGWGYHGGWGHPGMGWRDHGSDYSEDWDRPGMGPWERPYMMGGGWGHPGMMGGGHPGMMGGGHHGMMAHPGMMGPGGMHGHGMMVPMFMAMVDTNNDGGLSLEEVQAVHARMFNFIDRNKDGRVTPDEVQMAFMGGSSGVSAAPTVGATTGTGQGTTNQ
jgi:hypothetical protein